MSEQAFHFFRAAWTTYGILRMAHLNDGETFNWLGEMAEELIRLEMRVYQTEIHF